MTNSKKQYIAGMTPTIAGTSRRLHCRRRPSSYKVGPGTVVAAHLPRRGEVATASCSSIGKSQS